MKKETLSITEPVPGDTLPGGVRYILREPGGKTLYAYEHLHPAVSATVVVYDRIRAKYLLIERGNEPYLGWLSFPGGFLDCGREDVFGAAAREILEETGVAVRVEDLVQVDVRSSPQRDPRDHVVDIGFYVEVDEADPAAGDDAAAVRWLTAEEVDRAQLAFDLRGLWDSIKRRRG